MFCHSTENITRFVQLQGRAQKGLHNSLNDKPVIDHENPRMSIGKRIKEARKQAGMNQEQLAAACGWDSISRVSMYERDEREPKADDTKKLAKALKVPPEWLTFGVKGNDAGIDVAYLADCLKAVEEAQTIEQVELTPAQKVNLALYLYQHQPKNSALEARSLLSLFA